MVLQRVVAALVEEVGIPSMANPPPLGVWEAETLVFCSNVRADRAAMLDLPPSWPQQYSGRRCRRGNAGGHRHEFLIVQNC